ncbi:MAG: glycoside hydrolase family 18 protein, partial [Planctomycetota bacterium]
MMNRRYFQSFAMFLVVEFFGLTLIANSAVGDDVEVLDTGKSATADGRMIVAGYLPYYHVASVRQLHPVLDDVMLFGAEVDAGGSLDLSNLSPRVLSRFESLRRGRPEVRYLLTVGGWGKSTGFARMTRDAALRKSFISGLVDFCRDHHFHGVDYDWEHPDDEKEAADYERLVIETRAALGSQGVVTVAVASWQPLPTSFFQQVDRVHLMSYDHGFP